MRVLYLTPGHAAHDARFAEAIASAGHQAIVHVVSARGDDRLRREDVRAALEDHRPDVVHAGPIQAVARLVAEVGGHPLLAVSWGFDLLETGQPTAELERARLTLARSDALLVDCDAARVVAQTLGMPPDRIVTLPWGVDVDAYQPGRTAAARSMRQRAGWDDDIVATMTRSLEPRYGVDVALKGFIEASEAQPNLKLFVVGDGSLRRSMEEAVSSAGAESRVVFVGSVPPSEMKVYFSAADLYVSASLVDGTSVSLLEAMASGLPAVVPDVGGNREWVLPRNSGRLFASGDATGLAAAILELCALGVIGMRGLGMRGREMVEGSANWRANVPRLIDAYELARRASQPS